MSEVNNFSAIIRRSTAFPRMTVGPLRELNVENPYHL